MPVERAAARRSPRTSPRVKAPAPPTSDSPPSPSFFRRKRFLFAASVVVLAMATLVYMGIRSTAMYYMEVGELLAQGEAIYGEKVRMGGDVVEGSIQSDPSGGALHFSLTDGTHTVPVVYRGVVPDAFEPGAEVVMDGALSSSGTFEASSLLAKCPSKYVPEL